MSEQSYSRERDFEDLNVENENNAASSRAPIEGSDEDDEEHGDDLDGEADDDSADADDDQAEDDDEADENDSDDVDDDGADDDDSDDDDDSGADDDDSDDDDSADDDDSDDVDDDSADDEDGDDLDDADDTPIADLLSDGVPLSFTDADFADALDQANTAFADGAHTFSLNLGSDLVLFVDNDDDPGFDQAIILVGGSLTSTALVDLG